MGEGGVGGLLYSPQRERSGEKGLPLERQKLWGRIRGETLNGPARLSANGHWSSFFSPPILQPKGR